MRVIGVVFCALAVAIPCGASAQAAGGFAAGLSQGLERGAAIRERHAAAFANEQAAKRQTLCNKALENYLAGKGPVPPPMCNPPGSTPGAAVAAAPSATPLPPPSAQASLAAPSGPNFTNCTAADVTGATHCTTLGAGQPPTFTNCTPDGLGGTRCRTN